MLLGVVEPPRLSSGKVLPSSMPSGNCFIWYFFRFRAPSSLSCSLCCFRMSAVFCLILSIRRSLLTGLGDLPVLAAGSLDIKSCDWFSIWV